MEHTEGKWEIVSRFLIKSETDKIIANLQPIAQSKDKIGFDESDANAQLITAAPELLKVCKRYIAYRKGNNDSIDFIAPQMEQVIANAENK